MSRHRACLPSTVVIGASPVTDYNPKTQRVEVVVAENTMKVAGHGDIPYVKAGEPIWRKPKPMKIVMHFKNEAARRRCGGNMAATTPKDVNLVPIYAGCSARLAGEIKYGMRRADRIERARRAGLSMVGRLADAIGLGGTIPA